MKACWVLAVLAVLAGCNQYDLFRVEAGSQEGLANRADVLFVIDSSDSMVEESVDMAENFAAFIDRVSQRGSPTGGGLNGAVEAYVDRGLDPAAYTDLNLAITTIDALERRGALLGPVFTNDDPRAADDFVQTLLCEATCFSGRSVAPSDPDHTCADPFETVSRESLDCLCGDDAWVGNCGSGTETGIEAAYLAACRALEEPPDECFEGRAALTGADVLSNEGLLRPSTTFIPVVVTDEGDNSPRMGTTDPFPQIYADLFRELGVFTAWAVVGPEVDDDLEVVCPGATSWGTLRYDYLVEGSGGLKLPIHDGLCEPRDFGSALDRLGALLGGDIHAYPLARRPIDGTIVVQVDGRPVDEAEPAADDLFGQARYGAGWSYDPIDNLVRLHGDARPAPGADVSIYYLPRS
jgi:hypothetical protein